MTFEQIKHDAGVPIESDQVVDVLASNDSQRIRPRYLDNLDASAETIEALTADPSITVEYCTVDPCPADQIIRQLDVMIQKFDKLCDPEWWVT